MTSVLKEKPLLTEGITSEVDMRKEFGPRCPDVYMGCVACAAWLEWDLRLARLEGV